MYIIPENLNKQIGEVVTVGGFIHNIRDHGGLIFIDLRSSLDILQCVISNEENREILAKIEELKPEFVIKVTGEIRKRSQDTINPNLPTGEIEINIKQVEVVSKAKLLPFDIHAEDKNLANEDLRLKYRYLDLRREKLKSLLIRKHKLILASRNWFDSEGFVEIQTPILANSSPEGARDYLIPSRLHPGKFYALPQAPQQFKQLLMVGGFNKYFQIAPCFRDEDPRADRAIGDFYQLDLEVAWADQEAIFGLFEKYVREVLVRPEFTDKKLADEQFVRYTFDDAMDKFGSDKPDLRYNLEWKDAKPVFKESGFKVFADLCEDKNARVQALVLKGKVDKLSRSDLDKIQDIGRQFGLPGIAYIQYFDEEDKSPIFKFFGTEEEIENKKKEIKSYFGIEKGDLILFIANSDKNIVWKAQNQMRQHIAKHFDLVDENILKFSWIYNFPFFEKDEKTDKVDFTHNPFGAWKPNEGMTPLETLEDAIKNNTLLDLRAIQYDATCNGYEILSGGVRNHEPQALLKAFEVVGYTEEQVRAKFGHMLTAYEYGAPSHAGYANGFERLMMVLSGETNIREIIAFPKNGSGIDVMTGSPSEVLPIQLKELGISVKE